MFVCRRCGICCTSIGGRFSREESKRIKQAFRNLECLGVKLLIDPERFSIPLFPDEVERLRDVSKSRGINFNPLPKLALHDLILEWDMGSRSCPFYDEKRGCTIYEYRPLACRSFPVIRKNSSYELLELCPEVKGLNLSDEEIKEKFPEECRYADIFFNRIKLVRSVLAKRLEENIMDVEILLKDLFRISPDRARLGKS